MNEPGGKQERGQESVSVKDLDTLAYFYVKKFTDKRDDAKIPEAAKAALDTQIDEMNLIRQYLHDSGSYRWMNADTAADALLEIDGKIQEESLRKVDGDYTEAHKAKAFSNLHALRKFVETHADRLPGEFLKKKEAVEKEMEQLQKLMDEVDGKS